LTNLSITGSKTDISGFFRVFINDHEISSGYNLSLSSSWMELPIDLVDYIEIYRGDSSFSLGSDSGIFFIRIYTKDSLKQNGSRLSTTLSDSGSNSQSILHADTFENGWSYLAYFNNAKIKNFQSYRSNDIKNDSVNRHFYFNIRNDSSDINLGYTQSKKDNYFGYSLDLNSDDGDLSSKDYFLDVTTNFLDDKSLKLKLSYDVNELQYRELNQEGMGISAVLDLSNIQFTIPKEYYSKNKVIKSSLLLSKTFNHGNNNLLVGLSYQNKKYTTKQNTTVNFANIKTDIGKFTNFDKEDIYTLFLQDDYRVNEKLLLVLNGKIDKHKRNGDLKDHKDEQYRVGAVYSINENFGLKTFYSKTYIAPTFHNIDYAEANSYNLKNQIYNTYTLEGVYANENSRFSILFTDVRMKDFIYLTPVGFINIDHTVEVKNFIFDYTYEISKNNDIHLNYFTTKLSEHINNSNKGGYIKFTGEYNSFDYFTSLIYRNSYEYFDVHVDNSYNLNLGVTYHVSKNLSVSIKGENLLDDSTESLYKEGFPGIDFSLKDYQREITCSMKWVF